MPNIYVKTRMYSSNINAEWIISDIKLFNKGFN